MNLLLLLACAGPKGPGDTASTDGPTWYADVAPIVVANCTGCHVSGGPAFDLTNPEAASSRAGMLADAVADGRMPPWGAEGDPDCTPEHGWEGDRRLAQEEIDTLVAWAEAGAPLGDAGAPAPVEEPAPVSLEGDLLSYEAPSLYSSGAAADEFLCFSLELGLVESLWVDGIEVVPSNLAVAHHTLVLLDGNNDSEALAGEDGQYDCSGGLGLSSPTLLATWVPGANPTTAPEGTGIEIPAGQRIVLQMHYHPSRTPGLEDRPTLKLRPLDSRPDQALHQILLGNSWSEATGLLAGPNDNGVVQFKIPAGASDHTETMAATFDERIPEIPIPAIGAHMHLISKGMRVWLDRATPSAGESDRECLLSVPHYDYDWQQIYHDERDVDEVSTVSGGDTLTVECTYDNTLDHPGTARALAEAGLDEPVDVYLGEGTLDEMCLALVGYVY